MARDEYEIRETYGDWGLDIRMGETTVVLYFNSRNNAELVKAILEWEDAHPNEAVPYKPTLTQPNEPLTIAQLREMDGEPVYWPKEKIWLIVYLNHPDFGDCALNREGLYLPLDKCERRKVYRHPPEGEE